MARRGIGLVRELGRQLAEEHRRVVAEVESLSGHVEHIAAVIGAQRRHVGTCGVFEIVSLPELVDAAVEVLGHKIRSHNIVVQRNFSATRTFAIDKHKVLQILINRVKNAVESVIDAKQERPVVVIDVSQQEADRCWIAVGDNGVGIARENVLRIFSHGFTTKAYGTGFGLHASANAAKEMGGQLSCASDGLSCGARFTLELVRAAGEGQQATAYRVA